jgi:two-component system nitrate/nitrite response regulator NarL
MDKSRILVVGGAGGARDSLPLPGSDDVLEVSESLTIHGAVAAVAAERPALVVLDVGRSAVEALAAIRAVDRSVRVLVIASTGLPGILPSILAAGGCGVFDPTEPAASLREAVVRAAAGEIVLDDDDLRLLVDQLADARVRRGGGIRALTSRELDVLRLTAEGFGTDEVASTLGISAGTVRAHVKSILSKLHVHSKVEAVRVAWRTRVVAVPA